jgi:hypothetical protein
MRISPAEFEEEMRQRREKNIAASPNRSALAHDVAAGTARPNQGLGNEPRRKHH